MTHVPSVVCVSWDLQQEDERISSRISGYCGVKIDLYRAVPAKKVKQQVSDLKL